MSAVNAILPYGDDAGFSPCRTWRYWLTRDIQASLVSRPRIVMSIGVNPSTADETKNDPTVRRDIGFAKRLGADRLWKLNAFAYRATDPEDMKRAADPIGPENLEWIRRCALDVAANDGVILLAWGVHAAFKEQHRRVLALLRKEQLPLHCLGKTLDGYPKHPLYLPNDAPLETFE